ncbi:acetyltransferase [Diaporthe amygdali]|uniref:acetyltransferase n=1 Tax=Phomopsis amygdali TaxID=1214568 RepID=UPI0022FEB780|nr:acetyltransferase [Diaporthe amygdali]KAJ0122711.1 acetyltransferase [Diaporthe amygdali]
MPKYPDLPPQHAVAVKTDRIYLRPVTPEDLSALHVMRMNPRVMQYMPGVETEQDALKSYSVTRIELMMKQDGFSFAMVLPDERHKSSITESLANGAVIGFIGITAPPEVFYIIDEKYWGSGYATEALQAFLDTYWNAFPEGLKGMDEWTCNFLETHVIVGNDGSERVAAKCGFVHVADRSTPSHGEEKEKKIFRLQRP